MNVIHRRLSSAAFAAAGMGLLLCACGRDPGSDTTAAGTVNLSSLPAAEAFIDGKPAGTTPLAVSLTSGRHELVLKQTGFAEHRQSLDVKPGGVGAVDASLDLLDAGDPAAVAQIASAFGIHVDPFQAPEVHRGGSFQSGVALLFPRSDVRKEGLTSFRVDVTPSYDGSGWLEFRKGKTSLYRERFAPETLVTSRTLPAAVLADLKVGDTLTWGVFYDGAKAPVTARFEVTNKPAAAKKIAELAADKRLARQPRTVRLGLEAEVLQTYRYYSEALSKLLEIRSEDKDSGLPYNGIVSCLRRLDLDDSALYAESAARTTGKGRTLGASTDLAGTNGPRVVAQAPRRNEPAATGSSSPRPIGPGGAMPPTAAPKPSTPPPATPPAPGGGDPAGKGDAGKGGDPMRSRPEDATRREQAAEALAAAATTQGLIADKAAADAATAKALADATKSAADAARRAVEAGANDEASLRAAADADRAALEAGLAATAAARDAETAALAADTARRLAADAKAVADADRGGRAPRNAGKPDPVRLAPVPTPPLPLPTPPSAPVGQSPLTREQVEALETAQTRAGTLATAANDATLAYHTAMADAQASPGDDAKRLAADAAQTSMENAVRAAQEAAEAARVLREQTLSPR